MTTEQDRRNSLGHAAAGGALFGAGAGANELLNRRLTRHNAVGPFRATYRSARAAMGKKTAGPGFKAGVHLPNAAGKLPARAMQAVGLPLAAYGVVNAVRAKPVKTNKLRIKEDVVHPVVHHAVMADQVDAGQKQLERLTKALTATDQRKLDAHRRIGRTTSLVGGTLGLAALGARAPGGAKLLGRAGVRSGKLVRVASVEPHATALSNTLGVGAIGTGAAGSFNYAAQQKLERKNTVVKADKSRQATGGAIAGVGGVTAAVGAAGGGIPGTKSTRIWGDVGSASGRRTKVHVATQAYRGGEFGLRTNAHQTHKTFDLSGGREGNTMAAHFKHGQNVGASHAEDKVIRHLKIARRGSNVALAGGAGLLAYGLHRAKTPVTKANRPGDQYSGTLAGAGAATAAASAVGARVMEHQGRAWSRRAARDIDAAGKIIPRMGGHTVNAHPKLHPNERVDAIAPAISSSKVTNDPKILAGKSRAQAHAAGALRGAANKHAYFARTYGGMANAARKVRNPALAVAGAGLAGIAAPRVKDRAKERIHQMSKAQTKRPAKPVAPPTKAETAAGKGDREFYRHHGTNRFTTKWMGAEEFGEESKTAEAEMKNLSGAEGKPAEHAHWRRQLRAASEYHRTRDENDLADEIDEHLLSSTQRHRAKCASSGVKADIRKDNFTRRYGSRISPDAERGYKNLKRGRNEQLVQAGGGATMAGLSGWLTHHELKQPHVAKPGVAIAAAGALASAVSTGAELRGAHRYNQKIKPIKAKARSRRALGLYGPGRGLEPVDTTSARYKATNLAKAMTTGGPR